MAVTGQKHGREWSFNQLSGDAVKSVSGNQLHVLVKRFNCTSITCIWDIWKGTVEKSCTNVTRVYVCDAVKWFLQPCTPVTGWIGFALNFCSTLCKVQFQGYPSKCFVTNCTSLHSHTIKTEWIGFLWFGAEFPQHHIVKCLPGNPSNGLNQLNFDASQYKLQSQYFQ